MTAAPLDANDIADTILAFIARIGIPIDYAQVEPEDGQMPGMTVRHGVLVVDRDRLAYPGDLLHEAGHIAVMPPEERPLLVRVRRRASEEMAAIAWSYAAARAIGIDPFIVFHPHGYRGGGDFLGEAFEDGRGPGPPLLAWYGMAANPLIPEQAELPVFPHMLRWLR